MVGTGSSPGEFSFAKDETMRASAASAKVEKGRMKLQHHLNTLLYYASSRNPNNARPLEFVYNNMLLPSSTLGFDASNETTSVFMQHVVPKPLGDSAAIAGIPALSLMLTMDLM